MDPDASPLVRADTLASQGEQLSSRRAYQQALGAHTEAAKEYQHAAQATGDTVAAKALLLQRDIQLKLASEVQRKLERGRTKPAVIVNAEPSSTTTNARLASAKAPGSYTSSYQDTLPLEAADSAASYRYNGTAMRNAAARNSGRTTTAVVQPITTSLQHHLQNANSRINAGMVTAPRDKIDASTLAESRYSRKSNSPTQSQISHSIPNSGESARVGSSVEESYYLMKHDDDPADPVATFLDNVENLVEHFGNALAFASAPLHIGPPGLTTTSTTLEVPHTRATASGRARDQSESQNGNIDPTAQMLESFYVVPTVNKPGRIAVEGINEDSEDGLAHRPNSAMLKTHEELVAENTTLKETLDHLSRRMEHMTKERKREQDTLKNSVTLFARDMRKQAERLGQSTANLAEARRQMPSAPMPGAFQTHQQHPFSQHHTTTNPPNAQIDDLLRKIASLQEESKAAKLEAEKQAANAQRYKARYDDLRKAILEKRKAKEMATAAANAASAATTEISSSNGQKANAEGGSTTATTIKEGSNPLEPT